MISLTFDPAPLLTIDGESFQGINIISKLNCLRKESDELNELFLKAVSAYQITRYPVIGFVKNSQAAVVPTKRIIDVGYDLTVVDIHSSPTPQTTLYESHVAVNIPLGYYVELAPRSSLCKTGYMLANSIGIIDPSYNGTIKVPLIKVDASMPDLILPARVCQLILKPYTISHSRVDSETVQTHRGSGSFGSTD